MENTTKLPCSCGGHLLPQKLSEFDFSGLAGNGLTVLLRNVPGYVCDRCGGRTLEGEVIDAVLNVLAQSMSTGNERLGVDELRYLRKHLGLTQKQLAESLGAGMARETVADWERGAQPISLDQELRLRALVLQKMGLEAKARDVVSALQQAVVDKIFNAALLAKVQDVINSILQPSSILDLARQSPQQGAKSPRRVFDATDLRLSA